MGTKRTTDSLVHSPERGKEGGVTNCDNCSKCCETVMFELFGKDHETWAKYHGLKIVKFMDKKYVQFDIKCQKLVNGRCSIYENRPEMCRRYYCERYL